MDQQNTILIVENESAQLSGLADYLQEFGFRVLIAEDGESALEQLKHDQPDLVLLDIRLPGIAGFETCRRLKENQATKDIPVIFFSVRSDTADQVRAFELGAVDYIIAPIQHEVTLARLKAHLNIHNLQESLREQNKYLQADNIKSRRVQDALRESRQRYRLLADNATDMISRQTPEGIYRYVSPACRFLLGYEIEEMIGQPAHDYIHPEDLEAMQADKEMGRTEPVNSTMTYRAQRKDKTYIWLETVSKVVRDPETNQVEEIIAVSRDVSNRKQMEDTLRNQNKDLDAFAHTVAHDLKNPLAAILGYTQLLLMGLSKMKTTKALAVLLDLETTAKQTLGIVEALLLLAGARRGEAELYPLNMVDIVAQTQRRLSLMIEEYESEIIEPEEWPMTIGYAPWIEEVWANYLSNGLKYGGRPPRLELGYTPQPKGMIRFWVRDNGAGLTPEEQSELFTEFTRLSEMPVEGHGLGLSIVQRIVEKLGGQVGVESQVGEGSVFYFTLPSAE